MVPCSGFEIRELLFTQASGRSPRLIGQQVPQQKNTLLAEQKAELAIASGLSVTGPEQRLFHGFETQPPRSLSFFGPSSQRYIGNATSDDALRLRQMMPMLSVVIGVGGRREFLHDIAGARVGPGAQNMGSSPIRNSRITFTRRLPRSRGICRRNP
jgi:hypothetical protein